MSKFFERLPSSKRLFLKRDLIVNKSPAWHYKNKLANNTNVNKTSQNKWSRQHLVLNSFFSGLEAKVENLSIPVEGKACDI